MYSIYLIIALVACLAYIFFTSINSYYKNYDEKKKEEEIGIDQALDKFDVNVALEVQEELAIKLDQIKSETGNEFEGKTNPEVLSIIACGLLGFMLLNQKK